MEIIHTIIAICIYAYPTPNMDAERSICQQQLIECAEQTSFFYYESDFTECVKKSGETKPKLPIPFVQ